MSTPARGHLLSVSTLAPWLLLAAPASADTLTVPGSAPTIQAAIALAASGDTILVAPGTWHESIDDLGKRLVIEGTGGSAVTTIDAGGAATAVTIHAGGTGSSLHGFTITGGAGQAVLTTGGGTLFGGGGVLAQPGSQLVLSECVIAGNSMVSALPTAGGGVLVNGATVSLADCTLSGNAAARGAAVCSTSITDVVTLSGCTVSGNTAGPQVFDAAVDLSGSSGSVLNCVIVDNAGTGLRPGVGPFSACTFAGNSRWGLRRESAAGSTLTHCQFLGNGLGGASLAVPIAASTGHSIDHCIFAKADKLHAEANLGQVLIVNCTFDNAHAEAFFGSAVARNCIFRNTLAPITGSATPVTITYSDFPNAGAEPGNFDADPLWVNPAAQDYHLKINSPCIDAGDPASPLEADGSPADMGAVPFFHAWVKLGGGVAGASGQSDLQGTGTLTGGLEVSLVLSLAPSNKATALVLGIAELGVPFKGGTFWPAVGFVFLGLPTDAFGSLVLPLVWPSNLPPGFQVWAQFWWADLSAPQGYAASNGVRGTQP